MIWLGRLHRSPLTIVIGVAFSSLWSCGGVDNSCNGVEGCESTSLGPLAVASPSMSTSSLEEYEENLFVAFWPATMTENSTGVPDITVVYNDSVAFSLANPPPRSENNTVLPSGSAARPFTLRDCVVSEDTAQATLSFAPSALSAWHPFFVSATPIKFTMNMDNGQTKLLHVVLASDPSAPAR